MRRRDLEKPEFYPYQIEKELLPGEYAQLFGDKDLWIVKAPNGDMATFSSKTHTITIHDDGEVTMSPSLQFLIGSHYHGYMRHGVITQS